MNTNHPLIQIISKLQKTKPDVASSIAKGVYDLSLLSQRELESSEIEALVARQTEVLEKIGSLLA